MNTYDAAYALAKEIKESDEMKRLTEAAEKIKGDEEARKMVKEYIMAQMKSDYARIAGQKEDEEAYKHLQELAVLVSNNSNAQEYLQAFIRWNQVAADLQKIVSFRPADCFAVSFGVRVPDCLSGSSAACSRCGKERPSSCRSLSRLCTFASYFSTDSSG